jgi:hypothetical protein
VLQNLLMLHQKYKKEEEANRKEEKGALREFGPAISPVSREIDYAAQAVPFSSFSFTPLSLLTENARLCEALDNKDGLQTKSGNHA